MKRILCLIIAIVLMLTCVGCSTSIETTDGDNEESISMFIRVEWEVLNGDTYSVVYHKDTKVMYAVSSETVFTVMLDAEGNPLLWEN